MRTDRHLYLVSSQPGAPAVRAARPQLRLVPVERAPDAPLAARALRPEPPASTARSSAAPPRPPVASARLARAARPLGQRVMRAASDAAVFAVALLAGLRPNA